MADENPPTAPKPGYRTTEFYLSALAMVLTLAFASGLLKDGTPVEKAAAFVAAALTAVGYSVARAKAKVGT